MEKGMLEINKEERDFLMGVIQKTPLTGTIETLPKGLELILGLMKKLEGVFEDRNHEAVHRPD